MVSYDAVLLYRFFGLTLDIKKPFELTQILFKNLNPCISQNRIALLIDKHFYDAVTFKPFQCLVQ